ncbi:ionotropic receptor 93a [Thrips palmi]|uniref:Ionotropic receptor 93a n=1 Tax=Thrips palmi TaxID=161013 RepID=A0A6P8Z4C0_THRPL|nr:ionotropic receptor 93a [Thrips palmi]
MLPAALLACCMLLTARPARAAVSYNYDLTNATLALVIDEHFHSADKDKTSVEDSLRAYLGTATLQFLKHGGLNVEFHSMADANLRPDLTAVMTIGNCIDTWRLYRQMEDEGLLHFALTDADCPRLPRHVGVTVPLTERGGDLPQMILDMKVEHVLAWKSANILHDHTLDSKLLDRVLAALTADTSGALPSTVAAFHIPTEQADWKRRKRVENVLRSLPLSWLGQRFIVVVASDMVGVVMDVAKSLDMVHPQSQWLYVLTDTSSARDSLATYTSLLSEGDNVAFASNYTSRQAFCQTGMLCHAYEMLHAFLVALDRSVQDEQDMATQVSDEEWEAIRPSKEDRVVMLLSHIKDSRDDFLDDSPSVVRRPARPFVRGRLVSVGWWRPREGLTLQDALFPHAAYGFKGRNLPLLSFHNPPWQIIVSNSTGHVTAYKGLVFEIVNELAKNLNFTYTVMFPHPTDYGFTNDSEIYTSRTQDGDLNNAFSLNVSWDRMLQMVRDNKVFLGAGAFTVTAERKQLVNFTRAISDQPYQFMVVRPRELSRALLFMSPFTAMTWLSIAVSVAAIGPVLHWIHRLSPYYEYHGQRGGKGGLNSLTNCLWYAYGALLQQGGAYLPDADSGRLVVGTWWLVVLVLVTTYCGNLVAALTFPRLETSITSVEELVDASNGLTWGFRKESPLFEHMKTAPIARLTPVLDGAELHEEENEVLSRVRAGTHVYIDWRVNLLQLMKRDFHSNGRCDFSIVSVHDFLEEELAMIMAQESPYLNVVNDEIRRMQQVGLVEKWLKDYLPKKDRCWSTSSLEANNHSVNLGDMQGCFFVLFLGFIVAAMLILIECCCRRWHTAKDKKVIKPFVP